MDGRGSDAGKMPAPQQDAVGGHPGPPLQPSPWPSPGGLIFTQKSYQDVIPAQTGIQKIVVQEDRQQPTPAGLKMNSQG